MGLFEEQFEGIKDRYGNKIKVPEKKPTLKQSICAWGNDGTSGKPQTFVTSFTSLEIVGRTKPCEE